MNKLFHMILITGVLLLTAWGFPCMAQSGAPGFSLSGATVTEKDTFTVTIQADSVFTGRSVVSYHFYLTYSPVYFEFTGLAGTGSVLSSWGAPSLNSTHEGVLILAGAGSLPLTGSGDMVYLQFVSRRPGDASISFHIAESYLNERNPEALFKNTVIHASARSYPDIFPDQQQMYIGDETEMGVNGGTAPYQYSVEDPSVAVITSGNRVRATGAGKTRIRVTDARGEISITSGVFDVRAISTDLETSTVWPADTFFLPIKLNIAPGTVVYSGHIELSFDSGLSGLEEDILPGDFNILIENNVSSGKMILSFASSQGISGNGILCYPAFRAGKSGNRVIRFGEMHFNETLSGLPGLTTYYVTVKALPDLVLLPGSATLMWGDSRQIIVSNGTPPYTYHISDESLATIDALGTLTALSGGNITVTVTDVHGATGTGNTITLLDNKVTIANADGVADQETRVPVLTSTLPSGKAVYGYDFTVAFDNADLDFIRMDPPGNGSGVITQSSLLGSTIHVSGASSRGIESGLLGFLVFRIKNDFPLGAVSPVTFNAFSANERTLFSSFVNGSVHRVDQVSYRPVANAGDNLSLTEGTSGYLDGSASFDYDGDSLTWAWQAPDGIPLDDTTSSRPRFTAPLVNENTVFTVTLVVSDGTEISDPDQVTITVLQVNHAPVSDAGTDMSYAEGSSVSLDGSASWDPDDDALSYQWSSLDGIVLFNNTGTKPSFILPQVTENTPYRFTLVVNDGSVSSSSDTVTITSIQIDKKPVAFAGGDFSIQENTQAALDGSLSYDPENKPVSWRWIAPAGIILSSDTIPKPVFTAPLVHRDSILVFSLVVYDGTQYSEPDQVLVTIINMDSLSHENLIDSVMLSPLDSFCIDTIGSVITLYLPYAYDIRSLGPDFVLSRSATIQPAAGTLHDFSLPVYYTVTAEDGFTTRMWRVEVSNPLRTAQRPLLKGWNWLSLNVRPPDMNISNLFSALSFSDMDYIKSAEYSSVWYEQTGWFGNLQNFPEYGMIRFRKQTPEIFTVLGKEINPSLNSVSVTPGWNQIAYLLRNDEDINAALEPASIPPGEVLIKGETGSAVYYPSSGWAGEIDSLRILHGYNLYVTSAGNLLYRASAPHQKSGKRTIYSRRELLASYNLSPRSYEFSSTIIAEEISRKGQSLTHAGELLLAYRGEECRGISEAEYVPALDRYVYILTCFSNRNEENISFRIISYPEKKEYETCLTVPFRADEILGKPMLPMALTTETATGIAGQEDVSNLYLYPNPVSGYLTLSSSAIIEQVTLYNLTGKEVFLQQPHTGTIVIPVDKLPPGIYTVAVKTSNALIIRKVVKTSN
ncbi:MAG: T9SS type A sorting domain-containing protein [Bacteroidales bacterium]|nr:T9SS type A sorting domain-containing protein [Bacteroidales bacterium]